MIQPALSRTGSNKIRRKDSFPLIIFVFFGAHGIDLLPSFVSATYAGQERKSRGEGGREREGEMNSPFSALF